MSKNSFYGYRTGRLPISGKAWAKLEAAERAAGIPTPDQQAAAVQEAAGKYAGDQNQFNSLVIQLLSKLEQLDQKLTRLDELERRLEDFLKEK